MKYVIASLHIAVDVNCPHCDHQLDLLNENDTGGRHHNDDGAVIRQACPIDGYWCDSHKNFEVDDVECSSCHKSFNVKGLDW